MTDTSTIIQGRIWKLGDQVNTDILHPPSFFSLERERIKKGLLEGMKRLGSGVNSASLDEDLVIVAGYNFGCGSSRETSVRALLACGIKAVVAKSFARIFFRSLVNMGIPPLVCGHIHDRACDGEKCLIDPENGFIKLSSKNKYRFSPIDSHIKKVLSSGGLIPYLVENSDEL